MVVNDWVMLVLLMPYLVVVEALLVWVLFVRLAVFAVWTIPRLMSRL
jgi:hypothetical protein